MKRHDILDSIRLEKRTERDKGYPAGHRTYCTQQLDRTGQREWVSVDGSPRLRGQEKEFKFGNEGIQYGEELKSVLLQLMYTLEELV